MLALIITLLVVIIGGGTELFIYLHTHGFHKIAERYRIGKDLGFWALGDRVLIEEDPFRSGYECPKCDGRGTVACENCSGVGETSLGGVVKRCSHCEGQKTTVCPECNGKGGLIITPDTAQRRPTTGTIRSVGHKVKMLSVGQTVMYSNFSGHVVDLSRGGQNVVLRILHDSEVLCGIEGHLTLTNLRGKSEIATFS